MSQLLHPVAIFAVILLFQVYLQPTTAVTVRASQGTTLSLGFGFKTCDVAKNSRYWGCVPGKAGSGKPSECDATQSPFQQGDCVGAGTISCMETRVGSPGHHIMALGESFDCLSVEGSGSPEADGVESSPMMMQIFNDGGCKNPAGLPFVVGNGSYILGQTAHCIELSYQAPPES